MGDLTSPSAQYTREWLEESVSDSATVNEEQDSIERPEGFASQLYISCRTVLQGACTWMCLGAREEFAKLYLWGQSFGPTELDIALEYSDEAHNVVVDALGSIGQLLLDEVRRLCVEPSFAHSDAQAQELGRLVEQSRVVISSHIREDEDASSDDSSNTSVGTLSDHDEENDFTQELRSQIDYLLQLGPTLRQNVLYARKSRIEASIPAVVPFHLSGPAWKYVSLVREKFQNAGNQLVNRLGEANWQRHIMLTVEMISIPPFGLIQHSMIQVLGQAFLKMHYRTLLTSLAILRVDLCVFLPLQKKLAQVNPFNVPFVATPYDT
ncbi:hypothetical protein G7Y79_00059g091630 [Physcia stellaris]|nr:hypothetical protein G7Y79_00059g091630 [Physcia stellaris]